MTGDIRLTRSPVLGPPFTKGSTSPPEPRHHLGPSIPSRRQDETFTGWIVPREPEPLRPPTLNINAARLFDAEALATRPAPSIRAEAGATLGGERSGNDLASRRATLQEECIALGRKKERSGRPECPGATSPPPSASLSSPHALVTSPL